MFSLGDISDIVRTAGFLFLLALAAQGLLELITALYSVRGGIIASGVLHAVRQAATEQLVDPYQLAREVDRLLVSMGLRGLRVRASRVDRLTPEQLKGVIDRVDTESITGLKGLMSGAAVGKLREISSRAQEIFATASGSFDDTYKRRLHVLMLIASAIAVLAVGADVFSLTAKPAPSQMTILLDSLGKDGELLGLRLANSKAVITALDSLVARAAAARVSPAHIDSLRSRRRALEDSVVILDALLRVSRERVAVVRPADSPLGWHPWSPRWWVGIFASILLVSLGPKAYQTFVKKE